jgi:adenine-specific DNA methylase
MHGKRLVEEYLPLTKINKSSEKEQSFIRVPKLSNLHPWPARRPYANARALTLASILPQDFNRDLFNELIGLNNTSNVPYEIVYLVQPNRDKIAEIIKEKLGKDLKNIVIVDPMAGGGSIPLEALRLGFKTVAMEYNPVAYLILKATLEYPAKYDEKLCEEVRAEAKKLINWALEELGKYYPEDAMNYIIARGYRCRSCGGLIPIIHSTKLGKNGPYIKLTFDKENKSFTVDISSVETEFTRLRCPYCNAPIIEDVALRDWVSRHKKLLEIALSGDFKRAKEFVEELVQTHILLVKQTEKGFVAASKEDIDRFV